jgi:hypothetical protein
MYVAKLKADENEPVQTEVRVLPDRDIALSASERGQYDSAARRAYELNRRVNEAASSLVELHEQFSEVKQALEKPDLPEETSTALKAMSVRIEDLRRRFGVGRREPGPPAEDDVRGEINRLRGSLLGATAVPTEVQTRMLDKLGSDLDRAVADLNDTIGAVSIFYRELSAKGLYPVVPKRVESD